MRILYIELVLFIKFIKVITKVLERKIINQRELFPLRLIIRVDKMIFQEYDIVRIDNKEYVIAKTKEISKTKYFLLVRVDEEENVYSDDILIMKQSIYNNIEPDKLYPLNEEEKDSVYPMLKELLEEV